MVHFLPEIEEDVFTAYTWYEQKSQGLGEDFLRMFYALSAEIQRNPMICPEVYKNFRRRLLRRFPYAVYYKVDQNDIITFGLFHCARNPQTIKKNLTNRSK